MTDNLQMRCGYGLSVRSLDITTQCPKIEAVHKRNFCISISSLPSDLST